MPGAIAIGLLIVVWIFVLTPWLLRRQKPIRKAGEAFDDTRVVYEGGSGELRPRRRPRISRSDVHASHQEVDAGEYEMVDAEDYEYEAVESQIGNLDTDPLIADEVSDRLDSAFSSVRSKFPRPSNRAEADVVDGELVHELPASEKYSAQLASATAPYEEINEFALDDGEKAYYEMDESYTDADEYLLAEQRTLRSPEVTNGALAADDRRSVGDTPVVDSDGAQKAASLEDSERDESETRGVAKPFGQGVRSDSEPLSEEELAFAQRRKGRGGWDPEADQLASQDRYRRRTRTLVGLGAALIVTLIIGFVVGGWSWVLPAVTAGLTGLYLYALRQQVAAEERLRARRIQQLRRARLGVRSKNDEILGIPQRLRRPGAVVLEIDDESPDFEELDVYEGPVPTSDSDSQGIADVREVDFRNGRRAG